MMFPSTSMLLGVVLSVIAVFCLMVFRELLDVVFKWHRRGVRSAKETHCRQAVNEL